MNRPPSIVDVRYSHPGGRRRRLWLPLFLLWPLLVVVGLIALGLTVLADALFYATGRRGGRWTGLLLGAFDALFESPGLRVKVNGGSTIIDLVVK